MVNTALFYLTDNERYNAVVIKIPQEVRYGKQHWRYDQPVQTGKWLSIDRKDKKCKDDC